MGWKVKKYYKKLSFVKKLTFIFTINTIVLLILTDTTMFVLLDKVAELLHPLHHEINTDTNVINTTSNLILSNLQLYAGYVSLVTNALKYQSTFPSLYASSETFTTNSISNMQEINVYSTDNTSFISMPFVDTFLTSILNDGIILQDINIKAISLFTFINATTVVVRSIPYSSTIQQLSTAQINLIFANTTSFNYTLSSVYQYQQQSVVSLTTQFANTYVEIIISSASLLINQSIAYIPSSTFLLYNPSTLEYISGTQSLLNLSLKEYIFQEQSFPSIFYSLNNNSNNPIFSPIFNPSLNQTVSTLLPPVLQQTSTVCCYSLLLSTPMIEIDRLLLTFGDNQTSFLLFIILIWSIIIILSSVALAFFVGDEIFKEFDENIEVYLYGYRDVKALDQIIVKYLKMPSAWSKIIIEFKIENKMSGVMKEIADHVIKIIDVIEIKKKNKIHLIHKIIYPLNVGEKKFQNIMGFNDHQIIHEIKKEFQAKIEDNFKE